MQQVSSFFPFPHVFHVMLSFIPNYTSPNLSFITLRVYSCSTTTEIHKFMPAVHQVCHLKNGNKNNKDICYMQTDITQMPAEELIYVKAYTSSK